MCSLVGFPPLPPEGHISLCEMFGKVHSAPADQADLNFVTNVVSKHPTVTITRELLRTSLYREELKEVFLPVQETLVKRLVHIWYEQGMVEALKSLANPSHGDIPPLLQRVASFMLKVARGVTQIRNTFHPHLRECGPKLIAAVAQTRDWDTCPIRCLAWHPHCTKLAVAAWDDSVRVFSSNSNLTPVLKCKNQRAISCLAWRPLSASELAVGCEEGVYVWQVDPNSVVTHPSTNCATILKRYGHSPVTSIAWSPQGHLLLTASAHDTTMYAWDVSMERYTPIKRMGGGGVCMVSWAPSGSHVFAAASGIVFRVWETRKWIPERWTVMSGRVQTACWSPCGSILMFATTEEPVIYSLSLSGAQILYQAKDTPPKVALRAVDLTPIELESGDRLGGLVHSLAWDHLGHHLAVLFKDCDVVAIFKTQLTPLLLVAPWCVGCFV
ncbi:aladin isoform X2 [Anabrus simplex]|uniref:aladin isoform X2 n=1 Tax=Anabrus simplex TaxID=316456 RepID=UPI0035A30E5C